jgi:hypothetical protein
LNQHIGHGRDRANTTAGRRVEHGQDSGTATPQHGADSWRITAWRAATRSGSHDTGHGRRRGAGQRIDHDQSDSADHEHAANWGGPAPAHLGQHIGRDHANTAAGHRVERDQDGGTATPQHGANRQRITDWRVATRSDSLGTGHGRRRGAGQRIGHDQGDSADHEHEHDATWDGPAPPRLSHVCHSRDHTDTAAGHRIEHDQDDTTTPQHGANRRRITD